MAQRRLPLGIQSFEDIRNGEYLYADKTEYIWNLVENGKTYFLSRPRRFGKSLFTSTLESYFSGEKDLFKGLWIESHENSRKVPWTKYPVISFNLSGGQFQNPDGLEKTLLRVLSRTERSYGISPEQDISGRFADLIERLN